MSTQPQHSSQLSLDRHPTCLCLEFVKFSCFYGWVQYLICPVGGDWYIFFCKRLIIFHNIRKLGTIWKTMIMLHLYPGQTGRRHTLRLYERMGQGPILWTRAHSLKKYTYISKGAEIVAFITCFRICKKFYKFIWLFGPKRPFA